MIVHLIYDSIYCQNLIEFVNENFKTKEHLFIVVNSGMPLKNINCNVDNVFNVNSTIDMTLMVQFIKNSQKTIVHFLFEWICEFWVKNDLLDIPTYWSAWGGDFFPYIKYPLYGHETQLLLKLYNQEINGEKNTNYRREFLQSIKGILTSSPIDYFLIKEYYSLKAERYDFFYPISVIKQTNDATDFNKDIFGENSFLLGNSASPTNNHLDLFNEIKNNERNQYNTYVVPFSYGGANWYKNAVRKHGEFIFGKRIIFLEEFINENEYLKIVGKLQGGCFFHLRQQGVGTIRMLIESEKTVFAHENPAIQWLKGEGVEIFGLNSFNKQNCSGLSKSSNLEAMRRVFSKTICLKNMENVYSI